MDLPTDTEKREAFLLRMEAASRIVVMGLRISAAVQHGNGSFSKVEDDPLYMVHMNFLQERKKESPDLDLITELLNELENLVNEKGNEVEN